MRLGPHATAVPVTCTYLAAEVLEEASEWIPCQCCDKEAVGGAEHVIADHSHWSARNFYPFFSN